MAALLEVCPERFRPINAQRRHPALIVGDGDGGKLMRFDHTKTDSSIFFDFLLQVLRELLIAFVGDNGQGVWIGTAQAAPFLVYAKPEPAADGLAPFALRADIAQGADLKHVRVVPAFA